MSQYWFSLLAKLCSLKFSFKFFVPVTFFINTSHQYIQIVGNVSKFEIFRLLNIRNIIKMSYFSWSFLVWLDTCSFLCESFVCVKVLYLPLFWATQKVCVEHSYCFRGSWVKKGFLKNNIGKKERNMWRIFFSIQLILLKLVDHLNIINFVGELS